MPATALRNTSSTRGSDESATTNRGKIEQDSETVSDSKYGCGKDLGIFYRLFIYGLCGLAVEVFFTALWEVCANGNRKLHGITSMYAMVIYGLSTLVIERMYLRLYHLKWYFRGLIYLTWTYSWEFGTGYFLRLFDACPWDYEPYFNGHVMGLITMEYAPLWYVGTMFEERFIIRNALRLSWKLSNEKKLL